MYFFCILDVIFCLISTYFNVLLVSQFKVNGFVTAREVGAGVLASRLHGSSVFFWLFMEKQESPAFAERKRWPSADDNDNQCKMLI